ncbi:MAG: hypothetical protein ACTSU5_13875 [Promethearchaeota archaeon]
MAKTGRKTLFFPFSMDLLDVLEKFKKKVHYVDLHLVVKKGKIEVSIRGARENVTRAAHELRQLYAS